MDLLPERLTAHGRACSSAFWSLVRELRRVWGQGWGAAGEAAWTALLVGGPEGPHLPPVVGGHAGPNLCLVRVGLEDSGACLGRTSAVLTSPLRGRQRRCHVAGIPGCGRGAAWATPQPPVRLRGAADASAPLGPAVPSCRSAPRPVPSSCDRHALPGDRDRPRAAAGPRGPWRSRADGHGPDQRALRGHPRVYLRKLALQRHDFGAHLGGWNGMHPV